MSEYGQIVSVGIDSFYHRLTDDQLGAELQDAMKNHNWWACDYISAEFWYRRDNQESEISRDMWIQKQLNELEHTP